MAKGCPNQKVIDDFIVYMNCAAIGIFVLSAITLLGAYGPYTWISPDDIQGAGGRSGLVFVVPLTGALVISGIQEFYSSILEESTIAPIPKSAGMGKYT